MVLNWIITIILFIVGLCLLVSLHELGHYITAKIFGAYCFEYSIGFGKKIIRRKSKFAETFFCIGVLPLVVMFQCMVKMMKKKPVKVKKKKGIKM